MKIFCKYFKIGAGFSFGFGLMALVMLCLFYLGLVLVQDGLAHFCTAGL